MYNQIGTVKVNPVFLEEEVLTLATNILSDCKQSDLTVKQIDQALVLVKQELGKFIENSKVDFN